MVAVDTADASRVLLGFSVEERVRFKVGVCTGILYISDFHAGSLLKHSFMTMIARLEVDLICRPVLWKALASSRPGLVLSYVHKHSDLKIIPDQVDK